ncbi:TRI26 protein, partial [Pedionomus torquatus]|nr:TRI26 protein [Pedionomus torquatus]
IGVAKESVPRDSILRLRDKDGLWALTRTRNGYVARTSPDATPVTRHRVPKRVRICLDYEGGRVAFF